MKKKKGIALITTLMFSVIVVMMVSAGLALLPSHRVMTRLFITEEVGDDIFVQKQHVVYAQPDTNRP